MFVKVIVFVIVALHLTSAQNADQVTCFASKSQAFQDCLSKTVTDTSGKTKYDCCPIVNCYNAILDVSFLILKFYLANCKNIISLIRNAKFRTITHWLKRFLRVWRPTKIAIRSKLGTVVDHHHWHLVLS